jgi:hypothetical protein
LACQSPSAAWKRVRASLPFVTCPEPGVFSQFPYLETSPILFFAKFTLLGRISLTQ